MRGNLKRGSFILIVLLGAVAGSFLGDILGNNIKMLSFLKNTYSIGTLKPFLLNLKVLDLTFGINFHVNMMTIVGIIIVVLLCRKY